AALARLTRSRRHHAASLRRAADNDRLAAQLRLVQLLHRSIERVQVGVDDRSAHGKMIPGAGESADSVLSETSINVGAVEHVSMINASPPAPRKASPVDRYAGTGVEGEGSGPGATLSSHSMVERIGPQR